MDVMENDGQGMKRLLLAFPETCSLSLPEKYTWYMALLKQHPGCRPLFKEGRNAPYITVDAGQVYDQLITEGFQGEVMESMTSHSGHFCCALLHKH